MNESSAACKQFPAFAREQLDHLRHCIDEHKWYLSEAAGHDVGLALAEVDFMDRHVARVAQEFRERFCGERCLFRQQCALTDIIHELNRRWQVGELPPAAPAELVSQVV